MKSIKSREKIKLKKQDAERGKRKPEKMKKFQSSYNSNFKAFFLHFFPKRKNTSQFLQCNKKRSA